MYILKCVIESPCPDDRLFEDYPEAKAAADAHAKTAGHDCDPIYVTPRPDGHGFFEGRSRVVE